MKEKILDDAHKSRLAKAENKRKNKATKALDEGRCIEFKPTGTKIFPTFSRVSKHRKHLWARQYMQHKKTGVIVKVEVKDG